MGLRNQALEARGTQGGRIPGEPGAREGRHSSPVVLEPSKDPFRQSLIGEKVKKTYYMLAGFAGQHVVSFEDLNIDIVLEVQNTRYSQILYLIHYVVPGLHFW